MPEYQQSISVQTSPDVVFNFVSDVKNLPKYLPTVHRAEPQPGERVRVQGQAHDRPYDSDGHFKVNQTDRRLEWGSDGEHAYSGWLQIDEEGRSSARVTVHLTFEPDPRTNERLKEGTGDRDRTIREGIEKALESIRNFCEKSGGKVPTTADR